MHPRLGSASLLPLAFPRRRGEGGGNKPNFHGRSSIQLLKKEFAVIRFDQALSRGLSSNPLQPVISLNPLPSLSSTPPPPIPTPNPTPRASFLPPLHLPSPPSSSLRSLLHSPVTLTTVAVLSGPVLLTTELGWSLVKWLRLRTTLSAVLLMEKNASEGRTRPIASGQSH